MLTKELDSELSEEMEEGLRRSLYRESVVNWESGVVQVALTLEMLMLLQGFWALLANCAEVSVMSA